MSYATIAGSTSNAVPGSPLALTVNAATSTNQVTMMINSNRFLGTNVVVNESSTPSSFTLTANGGTFNIRTNAGGGNSATMSNVVAYATIWPWLATNTPAYLSNKVVSVLGASFEAGTPSPNGPTYPLALGAYISNNIPGGVSNGAPVIINNNISAYPMSFFSLNTNSGLSAWAFNILAAPANDIRYGFTNYQVGNLGSMSAGDPGTFGFMVITNLAAKMLAGGIQNPNPVFILQTMPKWEASNTWAVALANPSQGSWPYWGTNGGVSINNSNHFGRSFQQYQQDCDTYNRLIYSYANGTNIFVVDWNKTGASQHTVDTWHPDYIAHNQFCLEIIRVLSAQQNSPYTGIETLPAVVQQGLTPPQVYFADFNDVMNGVNGELIGTYIGNGSSALRGQKFTTTGAGNFSWSQDVTGKMQGTNLVWNVLFLATNSATFVVSMPLSFEFVGTNTSLRFDAPTCNSPLMTAPAGTNLFWASWTNSFNFYAATATGKKLDNGWPIASGARMSCGGAYQCKATNAVWMVCGSAKFQ